MDWARELNQIIVFQIIPHGLANGFFCHFCNRSTCINIFSLNKAYTIQCFEIAVLLHVVKPTPKSFLKDVPSFSSKITSSVYILMVKIIYIL